MEFGFNPDVDGNFMFVDPHLRTPTGIHINGVIHLSVDGYISEQCQKIKELIKEYDIKYLTIDKIGFGMAWYDELMPWFEEYININKNQ